MASVKKTNYALDILRNYNGDNPYMLILKKRVFVDFIRKDLLDFQIDFIIRNKDFSPIPINKVVRIADWYGEKKKKDWGTDFTPEKVKITSYLGETDSLFVCYLQYRTSIPEVMCFLPKRAVLKDFLCKDYNTVQVDFDRYDRLSNGKRILLPHQKEAVKFLLARKKCILADTMGLGKTTSLSVAAIEGNFDSIIVVCPAGLKNNWKRELSFYVPERDIVVIDRFDDKKKGELEVFLGYAEGKSGLKKEELLKEAKEAGKWKDSRIVIVNYDILEEFYKIPASRSQSSFDEAMENSPMWQYVNNKKSLIILDEPHTLSNTKSKRYKIIKSLIKCGKLDSVYLATGTPVTNNPKNLYCVLNLIENNVTGDFNYYMKRYCGAKEIVRFEDRPKRNRIQEKYLSEIGKRWFELTAEESAELDRRIREECRMIMTDGEPSNLEELASRISHIYLRRTTEILKLPNKTVHEVYYNLTKEQQEKYDTLWDEYEKMQEELDPDKEINKDLLEGAIYRSYLSVQMVPHTIELVDRFVNMGEKVVVACCYDDELYALKDHYGDRAVIFNGKCNLKQKDAAVDAFMNDPNVMVFIGNVKAAGVGITLISSHTLVFNDFDYVPGNNEQMSYRVYRIGQTNEVDIYYQIFRNTQYANMWEITLRKQFVVDTVIKNEDAKKASK